MKIRTSFVSNSSSSSYICDFCGYEAGGYDLCLEDAEMTQCGNGHIFCLDHTEWDNHWDHDDVKQYLRDYAKQYHGSTYPYEEEWTEDDYDELWDEVRYDYELPTHYCPLCKFERVTDRDIVKYLKLRFDIRDPKEEMLKDFKDFGELQKAYEGWINEDQN